MKEKVPLDLLIAIYERQFNSLDRSDEVILGRVNLFLTIVSALLAGLLFVAQGVGFSNPSVNYTLLAIVGVVLMLGLIIYGEVTQWVIIAVRIQSERSRLLEYLSADYPDLESLLLKQDSKRATIIVKRRTFRELSRVDVGPKQIVTILNNTLASTFAGILGVVFSTSSTFVIILSIGGFVISWLVQVAYSRMKYRHAYQLDNYQIEESSEPDDESDAAQQSLQPTP